MTMQNEDKLNAIDAARSLLVDVIDLTGEELENEQVLDKLDQIDEYLRYVRNLVEMETVHTTRFQKIGKGYLYHLLKKHRQINK